MARSCQWSGTTEKLLGSCSASVDFCFGSRAVELLSRLAVLVVAEVQEHGERRDEAG